MTAAYDSAYTFLNETDTMDFNHAIGKMNALVFLEVKKMLEKGEVRIYDESVKAYLKKVKRSYEQYAGQRVVFYRLMYFNSGTDKEILKVEGSL
jgi:hypothetical protein